MPNPRSPPASRRPARAAALAVAVAALAFAPCGYAEKADREKPISFSGDTGDANLQARGGALSGNVIITQGTLSIRADRIVFKQNADNSLSATAYGNPVAFRQKRDGFDEYYEAYAQRIEYDGTQEFLELFDRALLKRGQDEIRSNYISYNASTELFKAEGRADATSDAAGPGPQGARHVPAEIRICRCPAAKPRDGAKDAGKAGAKGAAPAGAEPPVALKPAGELAPPVAK